MSDLIPQLCQIIAEILQNNPQADSAELIALVEAKIKTNSQLIEAIKNDSRLTQINQGDTKAFQTLVTGGIANIGIFLNDVNPEQLQEVLQQVINSFNVESDIRKLEEHGNYILENEIKSTINGIHIKRPDILNQLISLTKTTNFVFVTGERGSGKSSLIKEFANQIKQDIPTFCLRTNDLDQSHINGVFSAIGLKSSLQDLGENFAIIPKKYLIIESLEKLLELENKTAFTNLLYFINKQQGWTIITTGRNYAYNQIIFTYLQPNKINFETLNIKGFNDDEIQQLSEQIQSLKTLSNNHTLKDLIKCPFYADLAYRVLETGKEFTPEDGEKEFRAAVWQNVIAKEHERKDGIHLKRRKIFIEIAVKRAKKMLSGILVNEFDSEALAKLEEDNLICRDPKNLVSLAHDILEDWAIEQYIEEIYQEDLDNIQMFLKNVGHEPAMNRAFRLWLHQKLKDGDNIDDFVYDILNSKNIQRCWQDETISAVLQGDNPDKFLRKLKKQLFTENGELLKRFCFILRIACKIPHKIQENNQSASLDILDLQPHGKAWEIMTKFLYENIKLLSTDLLSHVVAVLDEWSSILNINEELPPSAREVGLLALYLLDNFKSVYGNRNDNNRKKILSLIIKTIPAIRQEFLKLLETDLFISQQEQSNRKLYYVDNFCKMSFLGIETAFFSKYAPEFLIRLAYDKWFIKENNEDDEDRIFSYRGIDVDECFGLYEDKFSPASGAKGPFKYLLHSHWKQSLDFILNLLNISANKYAHSDLDSLSKSSYLKVGYSQPLIKTIEIELNDGSKIEQYCSERLWLAYRGFSVVPNLLQSALMALENWLIDCVEKCEYQQIDWLFDYILRNSNSVMPTAVLASVATGFPQKVGKAALPLLQNAKLYHLDKVRTVREGSEINWHYDPFTIDTLSKFYAEERRIAALRPWRKNDLEMLIISLQLSEWRNDALAIVDKLYKSEPKDETMRFFLHRIDSRNWKLTPDYENNQIIVESPDLEPDLKDFQQEALERSQKMNRFCILKLWSDNKMRNEPLKTNYFSTWQEALSEAKYWDEQLKSGQANDSTIIKYGAVVTSASIFIRDYHQELNESDLNWCIEIIVKAAVANANTENDILIWDETDYDGSASAASILPLLFDFISTDEDRLRLRKVIIIALTHVNQNVRHQAAEGIRKYLWQRDSEFAQKCLIGAIEYAHFEHKQENLALKRRLSILKSEGKSISDELNKLLTQKNKFIKQFLQGKLLSNIEAITFQSHSSWYLLSPCLMIPDGSRESSHILFLSRILNLFFEYEQEKNNRDHQHNNRYEMPYKLPYDFGKRFAEYLFHLHDSNFQDYINLLRIGCEKMPSFIDSLLLYVAVVAEKKGEIEIYWQLWHQLSQTVQDIALELANTNFDRQESDKRKLIRGMLHTDLDWQRIDYENQDIALGKDLILKFVENAGQNCDVFESLASLMYHFPAIFRESGLPILAKHQKEKENTHLLSSNTAFYLEIAIQRFLHSENTGSLPKKLHESCFILLNAIIDTASSRAYYLREHLIRSRKIV